MSILIGAILSLIIPVGPAQQLLASSVVRPYDDNYASATALVREPAALPSNLDFSAVFRQDALTMLRLSPTFRTQCTRIARTPHLSVIVRRSILVPADAAVTRIERRASGGLEADVQIGLIGDPIKLIAHELEHVLEQLDGVDLAAMAARRDTGVYTTPKHGYFETARAIAIGERVVREVRDGLAPR